MSYLPGYITRRAGGVRRATTNGWWPAIGYRHQPDPDPPPAKTKRHVLEIVSGGCWEGSHSGGGRLLEELIVWQLTGHVVTRENHFS